MSLYIIFYSAHFTKLGKAIPVGAAYAHAVIAEDMIVAGMLTQKKLLAKNAVKIGVSKLMPPQDKWDEHKEWYRTAKVDLLILRAYAKKVYKATDSYLATLNDKDLDTKMDVPGMGMVLAMM